MNAVDEQRYALNDLLELSSLMLEKALSDDWEKVCKLQSDRDALIHTFFVEKVVLDREEVSTVVNRMLVCDKELMLLCKNERTIVQKKMTKIKLGKNVIKAYSL